MKPLSAITYVRENKGRAGIIIFLFFFTTLLYLAGNYVDSVYYYWDRAMEYSDRLCVVSWTSADEDGEDYNTFRKRLESDEKLIVQGKSGRGYRGLPWICTMGFEMGSASMVFNSPEDLKEAFDVFGIKADLSDVTDGSVCLSSALARQYGLKKGDVLDASVSEGIEGRYVISAILEDDSYILFYVDYTPNEYRLNVLSRELCGPELRDYVNELRGDLKVQVDQSTRKGVESQFEPFLYVFGAGIVLLSLVLAVIVNSVIAGQYAARTYEFGVYRAIGISKREVYGKCAREILLMDLIAILCGAALSFSFTFLTNELYYLPAGRYLPYGSEIGLYGFVASNLLVVVPTILLKGRSMSKADVTEF